MKNRISILEIALYAMLGAAVYALKVVMQPLPNIEPVSMFVMVFALTFRVRGLFPLAVYLLLDGLFSGFSIWWVPYIYIWLILWGVTVLLPKNMPKKAQWIVYPIVCGLSGLMFGTLYAPMSAIVFSYDFNQTFEWILAGLPFDLLHGVGNLCFGLLIIPLVSLIRKLIKQL